MKKEKTCFKKTCAECGKKLGFLKGYRHPIEDKKKCVCGDCLERIEKSEREYNKFIRNAICKDNKRIPCYVIINTKPKYEKKVFNSLNNFSEIKEIHPLLGRHDLIAKIEIDNYNNLGSFILNKIRPIKGIKNTRTLTGSFSLQ